MNGRDSHLYNAQQVWFSGSSCVLRCNPRLPYLTDGLDRSSIPLGKWLGKGKPPKIVGHAECWPVATQHWWPHVFTTPRLCISRCAQPKRTLPIIPHAVSSYAWEASQGFLREHNTACEGHLTSRLQAFRLWLVTSNKKTPVLVLYILPWLSSRSEVILGYETLTELVQLVTDSAVFNNSSHQIPEDPLQSRSHLP